MSKSKIRAKIAAILAATSLAITAMTPYAKTDKKTSNNTVTTISQDEQHEKFERNQYKCKITGILTKDKSVAYTGVEVKEFKSTNNNEVWVRNTDAEEEIIDENNITITDPRAITTNGTASFVVQYNREKTIAPIITKATLIINNTTIDDTFKERYDVIASSIRERIFNKHFGGYKMAYENCHFKNTEIPYYDAPVTIENSKGTIVNPINNTLNAQNSITLKNIPAENNFSITEGNTEIPVIVDKDTQITVSIDDTYGPNNNKPTIRIAVSSENGTISNNTLNTAVAIGNAIYETNNMEQFITIYKRM